MRTRKNQDQNRNAQLLRTLAILRDLDRLGGVDLYELAERYGTTLRTIRRDFDALRDAGVPLVEEDGDGKRKRWRVAYRDSLTKLGDLLDASHYLALRVAMGQGGAVRTTSPMFPALEDLSGKIEAAVGAAGREKLRAIEDCFYSYEKFAYRRTAPDVLWPLVEAITDRRLCQVRYRAPRPKPKDTLFKVLPLRLFAHHGTVYLMCHVPRFDSLVTLNLQRLQELTVLEQRGDIPKGFRPENLENAAFGVFSGGNSTKYRLRFSAAVAPIIRERVWHPTQVARDRRGGGLDLEFTCAESVEVTAWVASWRHDVEVLEPTFLRRELHELGEWLTQEYPAPKNRTKRRRARTSGGS